MDTKEENIIAVIKKNQEIGFELLVSKYSQRIYWHIRRAVISHEDAEDVTQETFIKIFRSIDKLKSHESLTCWIYRIATNEALRFLEQRKTNVFPIDEAPALTADSYVNYSDLEAIVLKKAINSLPPKQRVTFNMRYYDELEYEEIAAILDTEVNNVRANYHNAKERIVKYMNSIIQNI